ncbi:MAG: DUF362 domain-containing protein [Dehalococcoidia bacterium]|nr:DUF362 domain-containing protein [Dehalococcoidia bacterium]
MILDRIVGIYHFLGDRAPRDVPVVEPKPRRVSPWRRDGKALVAMVKAGDDVRLTIEKVIALLGGLRLAISRGDRVLVKPNFNSPDPPPASTDLNFLRAVVGILLDTGAKVTIGESAGGVWRPSRNVFRAAGLFELARELGVEAIPFEDRVKDWVRVRVNGDYFRTVTMPRSAYEAEKLVYLPCMKTHMLASFSGAMKLAMGFIHPGERRGMHLGHLQEKIAEISLCWQPDLIIMDGRRAFVTGGPASGQLEEPGIILASGDLLATDVEAMKVVLSYRAKSGLPENPWQLPQIVTALKHGLGAGADGYVVIRGT